MTDSRTAQHRRRIHPTEALRLMGIEQWRLRQLRTSPARNTEPAPGPADRAPEKQHSEKPRIRPAVEPAAEKADTVVALTELHLYRFDGLVLLSPDMPSDNLARGLAHLLTPGWKNMKKRTLPLAASSLKSIADLLDGMTEHLNDEQLVLFGDSLKSAVEQHPPKAGIKPVFAPAANRLATDADAKRAFWLKLISEGRVSGA